jgi:hypothetical protein
LALNPLVERLLPGKIGIAGFVLDHDAGRFLRRPARPTRPRPEEKQTGQDDDDVGDEEIKDQPEKSGEHLPNLAEPPAPVNLLIIVGLKSKMMLIMSGACCLANRKACLHKEGPWIFF